MVEIPFIHLMKTPYGFYFYDVNTNQLLRTEQDVYDALDKLMHGNNSDISIETCKKISLMKSKGLLSAHHPKKIIHASDIDLEEKMNHYMRMITLQVTQQCNFRCSYCIYSEEKNKGQRSHSNKTMSWETAKKSIDFLFAHSDKMKEISIGFYGGEPLLEFGLIKKCVAYAKEKGVGKDILFSMTTNGSLITNDIAEFIAKENFNLIISLDGPKELHDKSRILACNGKGSFEIIDCNLKKVKEKFPDYYKEIAFSIVISPDKDFQCVNEMFLNYDLVKGQRSLTSFVDSYDDNSVVYDDFVLVPYNKEKFKSLLHICGMESKEISEISKRTLDDIHKINERLKKSRLSEEIAPGGPCIPGVTRFFVSYNGKFYPCERVSETSNIMNIGNIDSGFDYNKARKLLNVAQCTEDNCKKCWAMIFCTLCARQCDGGDDFDPEKRLKHCDSVRYNTEQKMKTYLALNEVKTNYGSYLNKYNV